MPTPTQKFSVTFRTPEGQIHTDVLGSEDIARTYVRVLSTSCHQVIELRNVYSDEVLDI